MYERAAALICAFRAETRAPSPPPLSTYRGSEGGCCVVSFGGLGVATCFVTSLPPSLPLLLLVASTIRTSREYVRVNWFARRNVDSYLPVTMCFVLCGVALFDVYSFDVFLLSFLSLPFFFFAGGRLRRLHLHRGRPVHPCGEWPHERAPVFCLCSAVPQLPSRSFVLRSELCNDGRTPIILDSVYGHLLTQIPSQCTCRYR